MPGLIQKSGYIKPGNGGGHYAEYIATREGVELIEAPSPSHDGGGYLEYMAERPRLPRSVLCRRSRRSGENHGGDQRAHRAGVDLRLLPETGGRTPAGLRNQ